MKLLTFPKPAEGETPRQVINRVLVEEKESLDNPDNHIIIIVRAVQGSEYHNGMNSAERLWLMAHIKKRILESDLE